MDLVLGHVVIARIVSELTVRYGETSFVVVAQHRSVHEPASTSESPQRKEPNLHTQNFTMTLTIQSNHCKVGAEKRGICQRREG